MDKWLIRTKAVAGGSVDTVSNTAASAASSTACVNNGQTDEAEHFVGPQLVPDDGDADSDAVVETSQMNK
jgi:hypothetical protein